MEAAAERFCSLTWDLHQGPPVTDAILLNWDRRSVCCFPAPTYWFGKWGRCGVCSQSILHSLSGVPPGGSSGGHSDPLMPIGEAAIPGRHDSPPVRGSACKVALVLEAPLWLATFFPGRRGPSATL